MLTFAAAVLLGGRSADAAIALDNTSKAVIASSSSTLSWSHTLNAGSANKRLVVVGVQSESTNTANQVITSVTFNGVAMTAVSSGSAAAGDNRIDLFYLLDASLPSSSGSYSVVVSLAGNVGHLIGGAISLTGAKQAAADAVSSATTGTGGNSTLSASVTTLAASSWVVSLFGAGHGSSEGTTYSTSDGTERWQDKTGSSSAGMSTKLQASAGLSTVTWNSTSSMRFVVLAAAFAPDVPAINGTVFEDVTYAGGAGRSQASSSGNGRPGARVELYNSSNSLLSSTTTDANGAYSFTGVSASTTYKVRVVNSTVTSSLGGGSLLPVQTFRTNASSGTAAAVTDYVGGEDPAKADAGNGSTTLPSTTGSVTVQSLTTVTLGASGYSITGVDFGYSFCTIVNVNDSGQGSLRQFITNANAMSGAQSSVCMIPGGSAVPGLRSGVASQLTSGVAVITVTSALPAIADALTLDGASQTANVGDANGGALGAGGVVGVDALTLSPVNRPEVELVASGSVARGFEVAASNVTIRGFSIHGFGVGGTSASAEIVVTSGSGVLVTQNVLGATAASFTAPASAGSGRNGIRVLGGSGAITQNLIGFNGYLGIWMTGTSSGWMIDGNEIRRTSSISTGNEALSISTSVHTIRGNLITDNLVAGIDLYSTSATGNTIENNTITGNAVGSHAGSSFAINLASSSNVIDRNIIAQNFGAGVVVQSGAAGNRITRNSIHGNGAGVNEGGGGPTNQIGIDLLSAADDANFGTAPFVTLNDSGDADAGGNGLLNTPVIDTATIVGSNLELTGWTTSGATVEFFLSDGVAGGFGQGQTFLASGVEGGPGDLDAGTGSYSGEVNCFSQGADANVARFKFVIPKPDPVSVGGRITATATDGSNNTSEFSGNAIVYDNVPDFALSKSSVVVSDPLNGASNPKRIPGAVVQFTTSISNSDAAQNDPDTLAITEAVGDDAVLFVGDLGAGGSGPVTFTDGATSSELTFTFTNLASTTDDVSFSNDYGATWTYTPTPDVNGFDSNVTHLLVHPKGRFAKATCGSTPTCSYVFRVKVR